VHGIARVSALTLAAALFGDLLFAQDKVAQLRARFGHEPNAVSKAKMMPQLGDAEFAEIDKDVMEEHFSEALAVLKTYRDEVGSCDKGLDALKVDAAAHPSGFKQLQFSLRDSLRRLDVVVVSMTSDEQAPFLEIHKELSEVNQRLIQRLFPRDEPAKPEH
jgi:hypothetical protein